MKQLACFLLGLLLAHPACCDTLLRDPIFTHGVDIAALQPEVLGDFRRAHPEMAWPAGKQSPAWQLVQWGSRASLSAGVDCPQASACRQTLLNGRELKAVLLGYDGADITLRMDGQLEFAGRYPRASPYLVSGEPWPHLLLSQELRTRSLADYRALPLHFEARLDWAQLRRLPGYDRDRHAALFVVTLTLRNRFTNDFLWLVLPVYDDRSPQAPALCRLCLRDTQGRVACDFPGEVGQPGTWQCPHDRLLQAGTGYPLGSTRLLFGLPSSLMRARVLTPGEWVGHDIDLKPWAIEALHAATQQGESGFLEKPEDFRLSAISLGWEVSGLDRVSLSLRNLSLEGLR